MKDKYYQLETSGDEADIYIFGDITSWEWDESDVSSYTLSKELQALEVDTINVHINSYGGEVAEGLTIYNMLRNHKAKVKTFCDGFACSIASVIFMAGDERVMNNASLLMIHNPWTCACGNSSELRKTADDLDAIAQGSINAYTSAINISEDELKTMLNNESWILPEDALEMGFATSIVGLEQPKQVAASAQKAMFSLITGKMHQSTEPPKPKTPPKSKEPEPKPVNKTLKFLNTLSGRKD